MAVSAPAALAADPLVAAFHRDPGDSVALLTGQQATFTSDSTPCTTLSWEVDGVPSGSAQSIRRAFADPGLHTVSLRAMLNGQSKTASSVTSNVPSLLKSHSTLATANPASAIEVDV